MQTLDQYHDRQDKVDKECALALEEAIQRVKDGCYDEYVIDRVNNDQNFELSFDAPDEYISPWRDYYAEDIAQHLVYDKGLVDLFIESDVDYDEDDYCADYDL